MLDDRRRHTHMTTTRPRRARDLIICFFFIVYVTAESFWTLLHWSQIIQSLDGKTGKEACVASIISIEDGVRQRER